MFFDSDCGGPFSYSYSVLSLSKCEWWSFGRSLRQVSFKFRFFLIAQYIWVRNSARAASLRTAAVAVFLILRVVHRAQGRKSGVSRLATTTLLLPLTTRGSFPLLRLRSSARSHRRRRRLFAVRGSIASHLISVTAGTLPVAPSGRNLLRLQVGEVWSWLSTGIMGLVSRFCLFRRPWPCSGLKPRSSRWPVCFLASQPIAATSGSLIICTRVC
jgi:hypothetical protein